MAFRLSPPNIQFTNNLGVPLAGGSLSFFISGTNTPQTTFSDSALTISNPNPVILDSGGYAGNIFLSLGLNYKVVLKDANGIIIWTVDPVSDPTSTGQSITSFLSITDVAATNRSLLFQTAGINRFGWVTNSTAESGSNGGSDLVLNAYDDTGNVLFAIATITRSTGLTKYTKAIGINKTAGTGRDLDALNKINSDKNFSVSGNDLPNLYVGFANGLVSTNGSTPNTQILVTANNALIPNSTAGGFYRTSISVTISSASTGANGLDTGTVAANTWYFVYLIDNGTTTAGLISTSATAPTLPTGYASSLRIGSAKTDASSNFYRFVQKGSYWRWKVTAGSNVANLPIINNSNTGSPSVPTWTGFVVQANSGLNPLALVPNTATAIHILLLYIGSGAQGATIIAPNSDYGAFNSSNPPQISLSSPNISGTLSNNTIMVLESNSIFIANNQSTGGITSTIGFIDSVNAN